MTGPTVMVDVPAKEEGDKNLFLCATKFFASQEKQEMKKFRRKLERQRALEREKEWREKHPREVMERRWGITEMEATINLHKRQLEDALNVYDAKGSQIESEEANLEETRRRMKKCYPDLFPF